MQLPLQITFRGMISTPGLEAAVRKNAERLDRFSDRIERCHVVIESPHHHHRKGALYNVRIDVILPGPNVSAHSLRDLQHAHEDAYVAIRDAFNAAARRIQDATRTRGRKVKHHEDVPTGRVASLFEDHGFIDAGAIGEIYFHAHSVPDGKFALLNVGDAVRYTLAEGESEKGAQASTVVRVTRGRRKL